MKRYFTCEAWLLVEEVVKTKSANPQWMCPICDKDADDSLDGWYTSLPCDSIMPGVVPLDRFKEKVLAQSKNSDF